MTFGIKLDFKKDENARIFSSHSVTGEKSHSFKVMHCDYHYTPWPVITHIITCYYMHIICVSIDGSVYISERIIILCL